MGKAMVLRTAGTNCDAETAYALEQAGFKVTRVHVNRLIHAPDLMGECGLVAIPGGFSYGDYIASGKILANKLVYRLQDALPEFVQQGGLVIGICNGFQVLVKAGLLPALEDSTQTDATLTVNDSSTFQCEWVKLRRNPKSRCVFTRNMKNELYLPIAHAEGKFVARNQEVLEQLEDNRQIVLQYVQNPNGSQEDIAGICDPTGRVFGLMPHPERNISVLNDPRSLRQEMEGEGDGMPIFRNAFEYVEKKQK